MFGIFREAHADIATRVIGARANELAFTALTLRESVERRRARRPAATTMVRIRVETDATSTTHGLTFAATVHTLRWLGFQVAHVTG
jgi:hypothetical protein